MKVLIVTAIYPTKNNPAFGSYVRTEVESLQRAGVEVDLLVLQGRSRKLIYPKGVLEVHRRVAQGSIDLVHAYYGHAGMVARAQWKVPVIVTYEGSDLLGWRNKRGEKAYLGEFVAGAGKLLARYVDAAIVQSAEMGRTLKKANVHVIPHEVNFDVFQPTPREEARAALGLNPDKKYLLFAANPAVRVKRFPLAKAVAEYFSQCDPSVELLVVFKETQKRLALYMSAADVLVFPSYQEGSPNIVKQAMACNLPIVSTDVGDVREIVGDTSGCYVCNPNVAEFAERISQILVHRHRTNGRENIAYLEPAAVARRVINVYEEVLRRREGRAIAKRQGSRSLLPAWYGKPGSDVRQPVEANK